MTRAEGVLRNPYSRHTDRRTFLQCLKGKLDCTFLWLVILTIHASSSHPRVQPTSSGLPVEHTQPGSKTGFAYPGEEAPQIGQPRPPDWNMGNPFPRGSQWSPTSFQISRPSEPRSWGVPPGAPIRHPTLASTSTPQPYFSQGSSSLSDFSGSEPSDKIVYGRSGDVSLPFPSVQPARRAANRDEFDGPHQFLDPPSLQTVAIREQDLPQVPTNLVVQEQDEVLSMVNDRLSRCAFDFVAKYQFPIPLEKDKRPVQVPSDREWTEWVFLLKRLATKRRIPTRVLYNGQIKQLVTVLENSLEMRHAAKHQSRPLKDDRNVLQLISAGLQVAKMLKDSECMEYMDHLYLQTEKKIQDRKAKPGYMF